MFLLIPQPFRDRAHNVYPFKFHYVSINSFAVLSSGIGKSYFKFHYVSINSELSADRLMIPAALNSIMFLLIRSSFNAATVTLSNFKFHYVSINSKFFQCRYCHFVHFKFHYVSINSKKSVVTRAGNSPLNSIMFLLILIFSFVNASR